MAYDKVVDSAVLDAGLTSIADGIRAKGGTTDTMSFPDGMVNAIAAIETGSSAYEDLATNLITSRISVTEDATGEESIIYSILNNATKIDSYAFSKTLIQTITIPYSITTIGSYAFSDNPRLATVTFENLNLKSIGDYAFYCCSNLSKIANFNITRITSIPNQCFSGCSKLTSIVFPSTVINVGSYVLSDSGVKSVTFKSKPTNISSSAFNYADSLTDIYVPWSSGAVANAPWGATSATIHYNS